MVGVVAAVAVCTGVFAGGAVVAATAPGVGVATVSGVGVGSEQAARITRITKARGNRNLCTSGAFFTGFRVGFDYTGEFTLCLFS